MRHLAAFLALLLFAGAAEALPIQRCSNITSFDYVRRADICGDGTEDCCPADLSAVAPDADPGETMVDFTFTTDKGQDRAGNTTAYACAYVSVPPDDADRVVSGSGACVGSGSVTVSASGAQSGTLSSLTAGTSYAGLCVVHVWDDATANELACSSVGFTTDGTPSVLSGYFVADGVSGTACDNSWTGTLQKPNGGLTDGPWCDSTPVEANVSANGSDVYYLTGGDWGADTLLTVDWTGTSGDQSFLAGYCIDTSDSDNPKLWSSTGTGCGAKPILPKIEGSGIDYFTISGIQWNDNVTQFLNWSNFTGLTVENVDCTNKDWSSGQGLYFSGTSEDLLLDNLNCSGESAVGQYGNGNDLIETTPGVNYVEIRNSTLRQGEHNLLVMGGNYGYLHGNTFDNTETSDGTTGYRAFSLIVGSDSNDPGEPYGRHLVERNIVQSGNHPTSKPAVAKFQVSDSVIRFNDFRTKQTQHDEMLQLRTCCFDVPGDGNLTEAETRAPKVANLRIYNNVFSIPGRSIAGRISSVNTQDNPATEVEFIYVFNNHVAAKQTGQVHDDFEFNIGVPFQQGNAISGSKIESNSWTDVLAAVTCSVSGVVTGTLEDCAASYSASIRNNVYGSSGGAGLGRTLTTTSGSGTASTTLTVVDAAVFYPKLQAPTTGRVLYAGDSIVVNGQTRTVTAVNLSTNQITLDSAATWSSGQTVTLAGYTAGYTGLPPEATAGDQ